MYYWHWVRHTNEKNKVVAKRRHGLRLHKRWNGEGAPPAIKAPPQVGMPALEQTHPFHFKMTPSMMMGPQCNHDLGVLLRLCDVSTDDLPTVRNALIEALGDSEYYCASYSSKEQPHIEGLLVTLAHSVRRKEQDIAERTAAGETIEAAERTTATPSVYVCNE